MPSVQSMHLRFLARRLVYLPFRPLYSIDPPSYYHKPAIPSGVRRSFSRAHTHYLSPSSADPLRAAFNFFFHNPRLKPQCIFFLRSSFFSSGGSREVVPPRGPNGGPSVQDPDPDLEEKTAANSVEPVSEDMPPLTESERELEKNKSQVRERWNCRRGGGAFMDSWCPAVNKLKKKGI